MKKKYSFVFDRKKSLKFLGHSLLGVALCFVTFGIAIPLVLFNLGGLFIEAISVEEK